MSGDFCLKYSVRNYESDFMQALKPSALLGYFQEAAAEHSQEMGMGFDRLREEGRFWVLSKICVRIGRRPMQGENVTVRTRPHSPNRAIFERSFFVEDASAETVIRAVSRWCVLDECGRIVPAAKVPHKEAVLSEERAFTDQDWKIGEEIPLREKPIYSMTVACSEYDLNMHMNNIKYADCVFNCFSVKELSARVLSGFSLHFLRQSHEGDRLDFYRHALSDGVYQVVGKCGEVPVVSARVEFCRAQTE